MDHRSHDQTPDGTVAAAGADPGIAVVLPEAAGSGREPRRRGSRLVVMLAAILVAALGTGAVFVSGYQLGLRQATEPGTPVSEDAAFQPFWDAYHAATERYALGPVDRATLIEGAIRGLIQAIGDPYSTYLSADEFRQTLDDISGTFEGIGAEIGTVDANRKTADCSTIGPDCRLVIIAPLDGSPALAAGLKPGDIVTAVDGGTVDGLTVDQTRDRIRGPKGTDVVLTIDREGRAPFEVTITRDVIVRREVVSRELADGMVGYVRLTGFSETGAADFVAAVKAHVDAGRKAIVVDLRGNPGGYITAARTVASAFISSGPVFWQQDAQGVQTPTEALPDGVASDPSIRVVVLVDRGSASAAEIVAGALQDTGRATLIGETTYGKGTVQQWTDLGEAGGFKLTTAKWLTPNKRWIHLEGLDPDVAVTIPANTPADADPVLDRALEVLTGSAATGVLQRAA